MKKISLKLTVLFGVVLMLSFGIIFALKPMPSAEICVPVNNSSEYEEFAGAVNSMSSQYPVSENAIVFLDKERYLTQDADGSYWVTKQDFENFIGVSDNLQTSCETNLRLLPNEDEIYELTVLAAENNYQVTVDESSVVLTRKFASRRLIISATTPINDFYGAVGVANYYDLYIVQYATEEDTQNAYNFYINQTGINVWTDGYCWVDEAETKSHTLAPLGLGDSYSYKTWGAEAMHVDDYSKYLNNLVSAENTSYTELPEVVVAVLDSGIDTDHPWFADRFLRDENGKIIGIGYKDENEDGIEDDDGHGTHCAGIICDTTLSNVKILPIKFMYKHNDGKTYGSSSDAILGIIYSITLSNTNLVAINMSFGSENSGVYDYIINTAYQRGIFSVAAAGNDNADASTHHPSNVAKAITVSSIDENNNKASSSNFGETIDVCAPGVCIDSASITGTTTYKSGTSMATPHITAYIALLKSDPSKNYTMTDIENILYGKYNGINTVYDLGNTGKDIYFGYGLPHLDGLTPDYTVINVLSTNNGTVSPTGSSMYFENRDNIVLYINPDENYQTAGIYLNNIYQSNTKKNVKYTLPEPNERFIEYDVLVEFEIAETFYKVNHYVEPLYDLNNLNSIPQYSEYVLQETENIEAKLFSLTNATAKNYTGFTPVSFEQETITDDNTVINIYYKRNQYSFSIEDPGAGLENIVGPGKYLYGDVVTMSSSLKIQYDDIIWETNNDKIEGFSYNLLNQKFIMPAMDLKLIAQLKFKKFFLNVKSYGKGEVFPNSRIVNYGDSIVFQFTPDIDYMVSEVYLNGAEVQLDGLTYTVDNITSYVELIVYFTKTIKDNLQDDVDSDPEDDKEQLEDIPNSYYPISSSTNYFNFALIFGIFGISIAVLLCIINFCVFSKKK